MNKVCDGSQSVLGAFSACVPGCPQALNDWCHSTADSKSWSPCGWRGPSNLKKMLEQQKLWDLSYPKSYNEVVIDPSSYTSQLPTVVEAFFYTKRATDAQRARVVAVRQAFLRTYGIPADIVPLLLYDSSKSSLGEPFEAVRVAGEMPDSRLEAAPGKLRVDSTARNSSLKLQ